MCRALYLSDNEFEHLSPEIKNMKNLRILALRDNELVDIPQVGSASGLVRAVSHQLSNITSPAIFVERIFATYPIVCLHLKMGL